MNKDAKTRTAGTQVAKKRSVSAAAALYDDTLVWDNHCCLPYEDTGDWVNSLWRYREAGVSVAMVNIGDAQFGLDTHARLAAHVRAFVAAHPDAFRLALTVDDVLAAKRAGQVAVGLDVEGLYAMGDQLSLLQLYRDIGVRWMSMVYNQRNLAGYGCHDETDRGLTPLGLRIVEEMDRVGIVKCCTHTGDRTARDVLEASGRPTIFSHSNPLGVTDHPRNIPDELMTACARTGGVVGINGVGIFLGDNDVSTEAMVRNIDYAVQLIGADHVGIGLDYVFNQPELDRLLSANGGTWPEALGYRPGIRFFEPERLPEVTEALLGRGYAEADVRAILGGNWLRVARAVWR